MRELREQLTLFPYELKDFKNLRKILVSFSTNDGIFLTVVDAIIGSLFVDNSVPVKQKSENYQVVYISIINKQWFNCLILP